MTFSIKLRPNIDFDAHSHTYRQTGFVRIPNFFSEQTAQQIEKVLRQQIDWRLIYVDAQKGVQQLSKADMSTMAPEALRTEMQNVSALARRNTGFFYNGYHLTNTLKQSPADPHAIHDLTRFLQSPDFLAVGEAVLGLQALTQVDAQATLFTPGSFLTRHIDEGSNNERRAAYTLSFTRNWQTDWGGQLQLINQQTTDVESAWIPRWNTLTIFDGRKVHAVSQVSTFAGDGRYSIVGWFRDDPIA